MLADTFAPFRPRYTAAAFAATTPDAAALRARWHEGPVWVGACGDQVLGTVSAVLRASETWVRSMAVMPAAQGAGLGSRLLLAAFDFAAASLSPMLTLTSTPFLTGAIRLYERHGFRRAGSADLHGTPLIPMTRPLPLERLIVYGTLAPGAPNHGEVRSITGHWRQGWIHGDLLPEGWGSANGYPALRWRQAGPRVPAWLLESREMPAHWKRLDDYEGAEYQRRPIPFEIPGGGTAEGYCYCARDAGSA